MLPELVLLDRPYEELQGQGGRRRRGPTFHSVLRRLNIGGETALPPGFWALVSHSLPTRSVVAQVGEEASLLFTNDKLRIKLPVNIVADRVFTVWWLSHFMT